MATTLERDAENKTSDSFVRGHLCDSVFQSIQLEHPHLIPLGRTAFGQTVKDDDFINSLLLMEFVKSGVSGINSCKRLKHRGTENTEFCFMPFLCDLCDSVFQSILLEHPHLIPLGQNCFWPNGERLLFQTSFPQLTKFRHNYSKSDLSSR